MEMNMQQPAMPQGAPEEAGRGTDTVMAHLSLGEVVIPRAFLDDPQVLQALQMIFQDGGADMAQYTVGDPANSINPETGYPEFKFGKIFKKFIRPLAPAVALIPGIGLPAAVALGAGIGAMGGGGIKGALTGGLGAGALGGGGALLGNALGVSGAAGNALGTGLLGAGAGAASGGLKGAALGGALGAVGGYASGGGFDGLGQSLGLTGEGSLLGTTAGTPLANSVGPTQGSGLLGSATNGGGIGGMLGFNGGSSSGGGGSSFGGLSAAGSLASALGGFQQDRSLKKQEDQLLGAQNQQLANIENLNPVDVQNDPGYQFNLQQGQQGLDRRAAAQGGYFSGAALQDAAKFNQDFANNYYQQAFQRQSGIVGAQNDIYGNRGNINANATMGRSNNINQTLANALGANVGNYNGANNSDLMALLKLRGLA